MGLRSLTSFHDNKFHPQSKIRDIISMSKNVDTTTGDGNR